MADYKIIKLPSGEKKYIKDSNTIGIPEGSEIKEYSILSYDGSITPYFGIVLEPSLAIGPDSTTSIFVNVPADTGIFITDGKHDTLIDRISRHENRYSLYGSASDGIVYRHFKLQYTKKGIKEEKYTIPTSIAINNKSNSWQVVKRIMFVGKSFDLFSYKEKVIGELINFNISDENVITTKLGNAPSVKGASMVPYTASFDKLRIKSDTVEMRYGP